MLDLLADDLPQPLELEIIPQPLPGRRALRRGIHRVEAADGRIVALAAVEADERVAKNAEEPCLEIRPRRELAGRLEGPGIGFLDEILGVGRVAGEIARQVEEGVRVGQRLASQRR